MKLRVSPNQRYLVNQDGKPFLYLGDTAWTLLKRLDRDEVDAYLDAGVREFAAPSHGDQEDWVLVLEDAGRAVSYLERM